MTIIYKHLNLRPKKANKNVLALGAKACHHQKQFYSLPSKLSKRCIRALPSKSSYAFCLQQTMPTEQSLSNQGRKHPRHPKKEQRATPVKPWPLHSELGSGLWILHPFGKDNIYLLKIILFSKLDPRLKLKLTSPPKQRSSLQVVPTSSK